MPLRLLDTFLRADAAAILGHLAEYFGKEQPDDTQQDDKYR